MSGVKHDGGKDPWHLAPYDAFRAIVRVLAFGAKKYAPRNWEDGMAWSRVYDASMRHATAWWNREGVDADTGYSHLWHLGCCVCFLIAYEIRGTGTDDRPTPKAKEKPLIDQYAALAAQGFSAGQAMLCGFDHGKHYPGVNYACAKCHCTVGDELRPAGCHHWITEAPAKPLVVKCPACGVGEGELHRNSCAFAQ